MAATLTLLILFTAGIQARNAYKDRSTFFAYTDPPGQRQPTPTHTPTPTPTPTPRPECMNAMDLVGLIDRPILSQTTDRNRTPPRPRTDGSGCLNRYSRWVESVEAANCIVLHQATPAQLCIVDGGYQYYLIGTDQTETGPYLATVDALSELHPTGSDPIELYRGQNPLTSKSVVVEYLPDRQVLRISTYYADTETSTNKPYVFTVNDDHGVTHVTW